MKPLSYTLSPIFAGCVSEFDKMIPNCNFSSSNFPIFVSLNPVEKNFNNLANFQKVFEAFPFMKIDSGTNGGRKATQNRRKKAETRRIKKNRNKKDGKDYNGNGVTFFPLVFFDCAYDCQVLVALPWFQTRHAKVMFALGTFKMFAAIGFFLPFQQRAAFGTQSESRDIWYTADRFSLAIYQQVLEQGSRIT